MASSEGFSDRLKNYRRVMGWTQEQLAKEWTYSTEAISAWERSVRVPGSQQLPRIAKLLQIAPEELIQSLNTNRRKTNAQGTVPVIDEEGLKQKSALETWGEIQNIYRDRSKLTGEFLLKKQGHVKVLRKKALRDALLDADLEAEKIIITILRSHSGYDILSEETPQVSTGNAYCWVVDPLDGSFNFQHGNPTYGVSISLLVNNVIEVGVIYLPFYQEMYTAIRGKGAWLNEQLIHVSPIADLDDAIVHVGDFANDGDVGANKLRVSDIAHLADAAGRVRMIGTAATDLAYIACGRADALVVHNALPWDINMGRLLIAEAGGTVEFKTDAAGKSLAICSNTSIHSALRNVILKEKRDPEYGTLFCAIPTSQAEIDRDGDGTVQIWQPLKER